jgi:hypothetical protein
MSSIRAGLGHSRENDVMDSNGPPNVTDEAAPAPSTVDQGTIVVVDSAGGRVVRLALEARLVVGSDPASGIVVAGPRVPASWAAIVRTGPGWLVTSLEPADPIRILDDTGRSRPVLGEIGLRSATLLAGATQILLQPPAPKS